MSNDGNGVATDTIYVIMITTFISTSHFSFPAFRHAQVKLCFPQILGLKQSCSQDCFDQLYYK